MIKGWKNRMIKGWIGGWIDFIDGLMAKTSKRK